MAYPSCEWLLAHPFGISEPGRVSVVLECSSSWQNPLTASTPMASTPIFYSTTAGSYPEISQTQLQCEGCNAKRGDSSNSHCNKCNKAPETCDYQMKRYDEEQLQSCPPPPSVAFTKCHSPPTHVPRLPRINTTGRTGTVQGALPC